MQAIRTAISIDKSLFDQAETLAHTMNISRSKLYMLALQVFIEHRKSKEMFAQINAAYDDEPDATELALRKTARKLHRRTITRHTRQPAAHPPRCPDATQEGSTQ